MKYESLRDFLLNFRLDFLRPLLNRAGIPVREPESSDRPHRSSRLIPAAWGKPLLRWNCVRSKPLIAQSTPPVARSPVRRARWPGLSGYAAPAGLFAVFIAIAVYVVFINGPGAVFGSRFPRTGAEFLKAGRLDRKLAGLGERIKNDPGDIRAFFEAGILKFQKGPDSYIDAISDLETARSGGLADIRTFYYLGRMYQAVGLYDFSLAEYRRFLNNRPEDFEVRMLAAKLLFSSGKYPEAVREYETLSAGHPGDILVLENLSLSRWKNKQDPGPVLDVMRGLGPEAVFRAGYVSGRMAYENKNYAAAAPLLELAAARSPEYRDFSELAGVYSMLSDSYIRLKSDAAAIAALNELLKINPTDSEARSQLARLSRAQKSKGAEAQRRKGTK